MPKLSIITATRKRSHLLTKAIDSLQAQTCPEFEWIVINDGGDIATSKLVSDRALPQQTYLEVGSPAVGLGLAHGRNLGLNTATGELITYLDDDNILKPNFVEQTIKFCNRHPEIDYSMPIQRRRRDVIQDRVVVKQGKTFYSPTPKCNAEELITQQQLIDSNGFTHRACRLTWNPQLRIYLDYEFFLQCVSQWGIKGFEMNPTVLLEYIQTNQGIIGSSSYEQWAAELEWIIERQNNYPCLDGSAIDSLKKLELKYRVKHSESARISGFI